MKIHNLFNSLNSKISKARTSIVLTEVDYNIMLLNQFENWSFDILYYWNYHRNDIKSKI